MHWGGVIFALVIGLAVMIAVWRLIRKLEGKNTRQPWRR
jgi:hypothetical protein